MKECLVVEFLGFGVGEMSCGVGLVFGLVVEVLRSVEHSGEQNEPQSPC